MKNETKKFDVSIDLEKKCADFGALHYFSLAIIRFQRVVLYFIFRSEKWGGAIGTLNFECFYPDSTCSYKYVQSIIFINYSSRLHELNKST